MKYALKNRATPGPSTLPPGDYTRHKHPAFREGVVEFERELTKAEVRKYGLIPIVNTASMAAAIVESMGNKAQRLYTRHYALDSYVRGKFFTMQEYPSHTLHHYRAIKSLTKMVREQLQRKFTAQIYRG